MAATGSILVLTAAVLLLLSSELLNAERYDIPPGYVFTNNASLESPSFSSDDGASYRILRTDTGKQIVSSNSTSGSDFSFAFFDPKNTGDYFLTVLLTVGKNKPASLAVPVWTANYNASVKDNATLMLTKNHQKLILLDGVSSGTLRWNSGVTDVSGIELTESGNLRLYDEEGKPLWESFNHPTNTLVPDQVLSSGNSIMTGNSSTSSGRFLGTVEASGFVLYLVPLSEVTMSNILRKPQPYQVWSIFGTPGSSFESAKRTCETSAAVLSFTTNKLAVSYDQPYGCGPPSVIFQKEGGDNVESQFLQLEENGDLVVYEFAEDVGAWKAVFNISQKATDACKLPTRCGSYGFCSRVGECRCISGNKLGEESDTAGCSRPAGVSDSCLTNEVENHHFVKVSGATYFSNRLVLPDREKVSQDDCLGLCVSNCSCAAVFYRQKSRSCYLVEELTGSMTSEPSESDSTGFVKFQNDKLISEPLKARAATSKSARTAIIFLAVLSVFLALTLAGVIWFVKTKYPHAYNKIMRKK